MTDDMKLTVYASRDLSEAYGEMAQNLVDTVARGAFETLPADARKTLNDYDGGTETPAVYIVRARDSEGVVDLAVKFVGRRAGVCFWDELEPEEQAAPYFSMGIDYETRIEPKPDEAAPRSGADSAPRAEALMTAEIVLTDHDLVFAFGGPVDQAEASPPPSLSV
ncbi:MAG TPA: hypothetical protein VNZ53_12380 [Steroidobacteraceae bacterium]|jgi:hypothetical protein|nr:hypothetical protein [Steroidobacteraceae bacterium]